MEIVADSAWPLPAPSDTPTLFTHTFTRNQQLDRMKMHSICVHVCAPRECIFTQAARSKSISLHAGAQRWRLSSHVHPRTADRAFLQPPVQQIQHPRTKQPARVDRARPSGGRIGGNNRSGCGGAEPHLSLIRNPCTMAAIVPAMWKRMKKKPTKPGINVVDAPHARQRCRPPSKPV